ncbi:SAM-dependent methyltransferase [Pseudoalteromonas rubra]|uniref:tRNA 5-carboxymethoxyuridine methyltransferase n=1 Tax=Pseudoalteromonas rubra TaxID=43658 RepID=A0A5S3WH24_9GAMM|nr:methyltransferase domain-containing protein [Pseudoalteromonas rubra]TMP25605.1 SAM-dependent methyltransferase [Pseudoalteromonas rubra]TMP30982.1 SAM-dependent methyltransferase [Pseudoalteromonas rubra]
MAKHIQRTLNRNEDRNFSELTGKFKNNIYGTSKGKLREAVLQRDLIQHVSWLGVDCEKTVLDVGGGQGQLAMFLAQQGHHVTLIDISKEMLVQAQTQAEALGVSDRITLIHAPLQALPDLNLGQFDLVLCHAVLEWLTEQQQALKLLSDRLTTEGYLSLMYYNRAAQRMANMVYGNFDYVLNGLQVKQKVGLSPNRPLEPDDVNSWLSALPLQKLSQSGVRCFHDYLREPDKANSQFDALLALELKYNQQEPYASLGRYTHLMMQYHHTI